MAAASFHDEQYRHLPDDGRPEIMHAYAMLVGDRSLREEIVGRISTELERTQRMLEIIYGGPLAEKRPNVHRTLMMREEGLSTLRHQKIQLLRRWRDLQETGDVRQAENALLHLLLDINAIASCLGTTG